MKHRLQSSSKALLNEKGKNRHHKRKSGRLFWPDGTEAPVFVQRAWRDKSGPSLQEGLGWLTGLINKVLLYNMGHSVYALMLIPKSLMICMRCDHNVLSRGLYLRDHIENRFPFTGHSSFSGPDQPRDFLVFGGS
jgi:hypothetical protein